MPRPARRNRFAGFFCVARGRWGPPRTLSCKYKARAKTRRPIIEHLGPAPAAIGGAAVGGGGYCRCLWPARTLAIAARAGRQRRTSVPAEQPEISSRRLDRRQRLGRLLAHERRAPALVGPRRRTPAVRRDRRPGVLQNEKAHGPSPGPRAIDCALASACAEISASCRGRSRSGRRSGRCRRCGGSTSRRGCPTCARPRWPHR